MQGSHPPPPPPPSLDSGVPQKPCLRTQVPAGLAAFDCLFFSTGGAKYASSIVGFRDGRQWFSRS